MRALRSQGLQVDLLGEDLTSKIIEVCIYFWYFYFISSLTTKNITLQ